MVWCLVFRAVSGQRASPRSPLFPVESRVCLGLRVEKLGLGFKVWFVDILCEVDMLGFFVQIHQLTQIRQPVLFPQPLYKLFNFFEFANLRERKSQIGELELAKPCGARLPGVAWEKGLMIHGSRFRVESSQLTVQSSSFTVEV